MVGYHSLHNVANTYVKIVNSIAAFVEFIPLNNI